MNLRSEQLEAHLARTLAPLYVVHGDEPLLALEAADALRAAARRRGFAEREVLFANQHFDWSEFLNANANLSLFGDKKIVELRMPTGKPGTAGAAAIERYCANPNPDNLVLVTMPRPEGAAWKSGWFAAFASKGVMIEVMSVHRRNLPVWIAGRLARQGQRASTEVLEFLADRFEGNLLAAYQEIQKFSLLLPAKDLELEDVEQVIANVARFDPYTAAEALVAGDLGRYVRAIDGLRGEAEAPTLVLFALGATLSVLADMHRGKPPEHSYREHRLWNKPLQQAIAAAPRRFSRGAIATALLRCAVIDRVSKGLAPGDPWDEFLKLGLSLHHERTA
ncbi:MAG: DNA polymerase III subunit delta [Betaproteobacteria bacterium]|nr:DNA polymerase III subunit delta [Betaproteobacteria bacterium]